MNKPNQSFFDLLINQVSNWWTDFVDLYWQLEKEYLLTILIVSFLLLLVTTFVLRSMMEDRVSPFRLYLFYISLVLAITLLFGVLRIIWAQ